MANRHLDWYRQAEADLRHAQNALATGGYEWACFAAQQAAEKAVKAVYLALGREAGGHTVTILVGSLSDILEMPAELVQAAKMLDKHYILTRYPNGFDSGAPTDYYTRDEATAAIAHAEEILAYCRDQIGRREQD